MPQDYLTPVEAADIQSMAEVKELEQLNPMLEIGAVGLKRAAGYIDEEFLPHLKGRKAVGVYREMGDNDPISGSMLFAIINLLRDVGWEVNPGGKSTDHAKAAKLVETGMEDMSSSWDDNLVEIFSCLRYGWSWHEIVYKYREGMWARDASRRSKYSDGLIGWRKWPIRSQDTLHRWLFAPDGDVAAMVQLPPPDYRQRTVPLNRSLLFRFGHSKNNPEGVSIFRSSYRPWYYKKRIEEFESVGIERDLAGLPMVTMPAEYFRAKPGTDQWRMVQSMQKMVRSVRRNEQEGLLMPVSYDPETKQPLFKFELMSSGGARQHDTDKIITRYEQRQLMTTLADFIMVGHTQTGTYNMHVDKTGIFKSALNATAQSIADVINRHAIPRLFLMNGWKPDVLPQVQPGDVDEPDLAQLSTFLQTTAGIGFNWGPDADLEKFLRHAAGMPELSEEDYAKRQRLARYDEAARFAATQTEMLAARSTLAQALAAEEQIAAGKPTPELQQQQMAMDQQKQQMAIGAAGEQRAAADHQFGMQQQISAQLGGTPAKKGSGQ